MYTQVKESETLFKWALVFLMGYFCIAWISFYVSRVSEVHLLDAFYLPSLLSLLGIAVFKYRPQFNCANRKYLALEIFIILIFYVITHYLKYNELGVWIDEYSQYSKAISGGASSLYWGSFYEQQPPLDYLLTALSVSIFGKTLFAVKFHALFFGLLFVYLIFYFSKNFTKNYFILALAVICATLARPIFAYTMEARPTTISLLFNLFYLYSCVIYYLKNTKENLFYIFLSGFVYLLTTGLAPEITMISSTFCFGLLYVFEKKYKELKSLLSVHVLLAICFIPTGYYLIQYTKETNQFNQSFWQGLSNLFTRYQWIKIQQLPRSVPYVISFPLIVSLFASMALVYKKKIDYLWSSFFFIPVVFSVLYLVVYYGFISWDFGIRYIFNLFGALIISLVYIWSLVFKHFKKTKKLIFFSVISISILFGSYRTLSEPFVWYLSALERPDWKALYSYLNKNINDDDVILRVAATKFGNWRTGVYVGSDFFANETVSKAIMGHQYIDSLAKDSYFVDLSLNYQEKRKGFAYIIYEKQRMSPVVRLESLNDPEHRLVYEGKWVSVYSVPIKGNLYQTFRKYFIKVLKQGPDAEAMAPLWESLIVLEKRFGSKGLALFYLKRYEKLQLENNRTGHGQYIEKKLEHNKRVKMFRNYIESSS